LSDEHLIENEVTCAKAGPGSIQFEIELPGEIVLNADKVAHIVPRFPGITQKVHKDLGDEVGEGEVLAIIQSNQSVAPYEIKSLVSGTVIEKHLTLGEFVRDDADIYVIADLSTVWAKISIYAKYLSQIKPGLNVLLTATGIDEVAEGTIDYVGPIVGEKTRTGSARVILQNIDRQWQPGLFVTARITVGRFSVPLAVPDDAIQTVEGKPSVFVRAAGGFTLRPVEIGRSDGHTVEILAGLTPGEEYAAANTFLLKAERGKSEAGHEH
jgi:cobalt-zinc-cadmium efflux system membrane fusion protein